MNRDEIRRLYRNGYNNTEDTGNAFPLVIKQLFVCILIICAAFTVKSYNNSDISVFAGQIKAGVQKEAGFDSIASKLDKLLTDIPVFKNKKVKTSQNDEIVETKLIPDENSGIFLSKELPYTKGSYTTKDYFGEYRDFFLMDAPLEDADYRAQDNTAPEKTQEKPPEKAAAKPLNILSIPQDAVKDKVRLGIKIITPVSGEVTTKFGYRIHPITRLSSFHYGLDVAASKDTPILSAFKGVVEETGSNSVYGNYIIIRYNKNLTAFYGHCSKIFIKKGKKVSRGQKIAAVGSTGLSTGNHLHLEFSYKGKRIDPSFYVKP